MRWTLPHKVWRRWFWRCCFRRGEIRGSFGEGRSSLQRSYHWNRSLAFAKVYKAKRTKLLYFTTAHRESQLEVRAWVETLRERSAGWFALLELSELEPVAAPTAPCRIAA